MVWLYLGSWKPGTAGWCSFGRLSRGLSLAWLAALVMVAPAARGGTDEAASVARTFRVMTFNIHHGEGTDGRIDLDRIAGVIRAGRADLVALQEVDRGVARTARRDLPGELSLATGMACVFSNNFAFQGGEYGNAVLTRFPVKRWANTHLRMLRPDEQRGVLQVVLDVGGRELLFLATHIDYRRDDAERLANVAQFAEVLAGYAGLPVLMAGDFNDTPGSRTHAAMAERFDDVWQSVGTGDGFTYPSGQPVKRIDYIWLGKGGPLRAVQARVPSGAASASDHLPLVAEIEWP